MKTFEENMTRITQAMGRAARQTQAPSAFCVGEVKAAGGGVLRVRAGGMDLEAGDLYVSAALRYDWTEDDGSPELLRPGDRVVLLSSDGQDYYLTGRMVRV